MHFIRTLFNNRCGNIDDYLPFKERNNCLNNWVKYIHQRKDMNKILGFIVSWWDGRAAEESRHTMSSSLFITLTFGCFSGTPLVRPPLLHKKSGLSREVASRQRWKSIHLCLDLHCQVAFLEGVASCQGGLIRGVPLHFHMSWLVTELGPTPPPPNGLHATFRA